MRQINNTLTIEEENGIYGDRSKELKELNEFFTKRLKEVKKE